MSETIDRPLDVPFTHRLRVTEDVLGVDQEVFSAVLEPSGPEPARVLFWLDSGVAQARPELAAELERFVAARPDRLRLAGEVRTIVGGEAAKNDFRNVEAVLESVDRAGLDRRSYVVVIGGGAVLDVVGFAAAIAHRGIRLVRLPTTTLAQADSGLGVKNGINFFGKKNWIGSFAVPWAVINDRSLLTTVSDRDFRCGFSEVVKVSLLKDPALFRALEKAAPRIHDRDFDAAVPVITASATLHLDHITLGGDPFEATESRPLDFGHWSAHRLEVLTNFELRHGEAVAIGVALDTIYSARTLSLPASDAERVLRVLVALGLPVNHPALEDSEPLFAGLEEFRQHLGGQLTLTLLSGIGEPVEVHHVDTAEMRGCLEELRKSAARLGTTAVPSDGA